VTRGYWEKVFTWSDQRFSRKRSLPGMSRGLLGKENDQKMAVKGLYLENDQRFARKRPLPGMSRGWWEEAST
jgi:hypothetical protein